MRPHLRRMPPWAPPCREMRPSTSRLPAYWSPRSSRWMNLPTASESGAQDLGHCHRRPAAVPRACLPDHREGRPPVPGPRGTRGEPVGLSNRSVMASNWADPMAITGRARDRHRQVSRPPLGRTPWPLTVVRRLGRDRPFGVQGGRVCRLRSGMVVLRGLEGAARFDALSDPWMSSITEARISSTMAWK